MALGEGFENAKEKMRAALQSDVAADIGGDLQRIERMEIRHLEPTFKHILLPAWLGAFRYGGKAYRLCVNGRTGLVQGERPYSAWKIALRGPARRDPRRPLPLPLRRRVRAAAGS